MNYLNLHTDTLRSPEFIMSEPEARATWLSLLAWCVTQENGGLIQGAASWGDRAWMQLCGVTKTETETNTGLFAYEGENLRVNLYPIDKEEEVKSKRETARTNGAKGGRPKKNQPPKPNTKTQKTNVGFEVKPTSESVKGKEGKDKGKEKERENAQAREPLPSEPQTDHEPGITEGRNRIDSITNRWRDASPHWTAQELRELYDNRDAINSLKPEALTAMQAYAQSKPDDFCLRSRLTAMQHISELADKALQAHKPQKRMRNEDWEGGRTPDITYADEII